MKVLFISGAYKNSGDFLIVERAKLMVKDIFKECTIESIKANEFLGDKLDYVNSFDYIVFPGGPGYLENYYPNCARLCDNLSLITPKMISFGMGWYGKDSKNSTVYNYGFSEQTKSLYKRIISDSGFLGCRDNYSVRVLKNNGFKNPIMTGCPAWYDLKNVDRLLLRENIDYNFKKICVSDPADIFENSDQCLDLLKYLKGKYPNSKIEFVFHRGLKTEGKTGGITTKKTYQFMNEIKSLGIEIHDISNGLDGFSIYDDADLHIGYRVHAHIYNLSKRNITILIEEDGRGAGVNEALGLSRICSYTHKIAESKNKYVRGMKKVVKMTGIYNFRKSNSNLINEIDDYIYLLEKNNYLTLNCAFEKMNGYYQIMKKSIMKMAEEKKVN